MNKEKILEELSIIQRCKKYGLPLHRCPQFLFVMMGIIIIITIVASYFVSLEYFIDPLLVLALVSGETIILLFISLIITRSYENLAEANQLKSDFVGLVSHQMQTPLTVIKWNLEEMEDLGISKDQERNIEDLKKNTERMVQTVRNFLVISKIEDEGLHTKKEEVSLQDESGKLIKELFSKGPHEIEFNVEENVPTVLADPAHVTIVIENFLSNAVKYSDDKIEVNIKKEGSNVLLEVKDSGMGIPAKEQKKLFSKFFRAKNALEKGKKGTGLGLYLSKKIIENLGGKVGVKSKEGEGSTFWFSLPAK